ncbi:MAG: glycosyltransferase family 39 protein [Candidatus Omnitrophica bacterium]|nr:glycosyltransferase family 39 protein [Candidatus Omnitrophota bacterium]
MNRQTMIAGVMGGILLGVLAACSPMSVAAIVVSLGIAWLLRRALAEEGPWIARLFLWGMGTRLAVTAALHAWHAWAFPRAQVALSWDSGGYLLMAQRLALVLANKFPSLETLVLMTTPPTLMNEWYGYAGNVVWLGFAYYLLGFAPIVGTVVSSFLYMGAVVLIYQTALELFNRPAARCAAWLATFLPTTFYWSINHGKEPLGTLGLAIIVWAALRWQQRRRHGYLAALAAGAWIFWTVKPRMMPLVILGGVLAAVWAVYRRGGRLRGAVVVIIGALLCVEAASWTGLVARRGPVTRVYYEWVRRCMGQNRVLQYGDSVYRIYPQGMLRSDGNLHPANFSHGQFALGVARGLSRFLFTLVPPWAVQKPGWLALIPQVVFGYLILPWMVPGFASALRKDSRLACFGCLMLILLTINLAATEANVGTALRHRDMLMPFYLLYAVGGLVTVLSALAGQRRDSAAAAMAG